MMASVNGQCNGADLVFYVCTSDRPIGLHNGCWLVGDGFKPLT